MIDRIWKIRNNRLTRWLCRQISHVGVFAKGGNWVGGRVCLCGTYVRFADEVKGD